MHIGLSMYGTMFSMGLHPQSGRAPLSPLQLMEQALAVGLAGVEMPASLMQGQDVAAQAIITYEEQQLAASLAYLTAIRSYTHSVWSRLL